MVFKIKKFTILTLFAVLALQVPAAVAAGFSPEQKVEIESIVKAYLLENGKTVIDAVDAYQEKQKTEERAKISETIKDKIEILAGTDAPSAGNPKGDITIIEFFDYNCGYCKRALPDVQALLEEDKNVFFVFRELPVLGDASRVAAKWSLAAHKQGKYFEFHAEMMSFRGTKNDEELSKLAEKIGLDPVQMKKDANSEEIEAQLKKDMELAGMIGISGTPAFIIGGEFYPGYMGPEGLKNAIKKLRAKKN